MEVTLKSGRTAPDRQAYTIEEFCSAHRISKAHFFNLAKTGLGPRTMLAGHRRLISFEAAADRRREREEEAAAELAARPAASDAAA